MVAGWTQRPHLGTFFMSTDTPFAACYRNIVAGKSRTAVCFRRPVRMTVVGLSSADGMIKVSGRSSGKWGQRQPVQGLRGLGRARALPAQAA
jgi:hypothetical protein